jgi:prepilin-type N-terminal cleavage/methylation domain-containing protein
VSARTDRGFGLVELLVTIFILGVMCVAIFITCFRSNDESGRITRMVEFRQSTRASVHLIERDVRMAGAGWGRNPLSVSRRGVNEQWFAIQAGPGGGDNDSLTLIGATQAATTLAQDMPLPTSTLKVTSTSGFAVNDLCVITDGTNAQMLQVTGVNSATGVLSHEKSSIWNSAKGHNGWPPAESGGFPATTTQVYRINVLRYRVDSLDVGRPCLVRQEWNGPPQVVADDLVRFQVWYRLEDGTLARDPVGLTNVHKIQPRIYTRVTDPEHDSVIDSVWAEVEPRTF